MESSEFVERVVGLAGGPASVRAILEADRRAFVQVWDRDVDVIGRLLRAHLTVEHFMVLSLSHANPKLGSLDGARLSFAQKCALLDDLDPLVAVLRPGIRCLNGLRNRLAHRLSEPLQDEDVQPLLGVAVFRSLREALAAPQTPSTEPIAIVEEFARFAATLLGHRTSAFGQLIDRAIRSSSGAVAPADPAS